ncbi:MAG: prepilin peptidase [Gemmatimonadota bacterium]
MQHYVSQLHHVARWPILSAGHPARPWPPRRRYTLALDCPKMRLVSFDLPAAWLALAAGFVVLLGLACLSDVRSRRVPNALSAGLLVLGLIASVVRNGVGDGLVHSLAGVATGLAIWLPMYVLRLMGAGDVKLFAAGAAWIGWQASLVAALATGLLGGALGLMWLMHQQGMMAVAMALVHAVRAPKLLQLKPMDKRERVPYALAIAGGLMCGWWWAALPIWSR